MVLVKTPLGHEAFKDRRGRLTPRQRSAFLLFDGKRSVQEVLSATAAMGITQQDVQAMLDEGLLARQTVPTRAAPAGHEAAVAEPTAMADPAVPEAPSAPGGARSPMQRYEEAYPVAAQLTASLGLRGFRLNLAVEGAAGYDDLVVLAPKIREAVGDAKYQTLARALFA